MTDYHPLITRAVNALEKNSGEARRSLYERARTALVTQLRAAEPALSESEITKERLALEEAIRRVEAEAARKLRTEPRDQRPATLPRSAAAEPRGALVSPPPPPPPRRERANPPAPEPARAESAAPRATEPAWPAPGADQAETAEAPRPLTAREKLLGSRTPSLTREGIKGFRDVVSAVRDLGGATTRAARSARDTRNPYEASVPHDAAATQHLPAAEEDAELAEHVELDRQGLEPQVDGYDAYEQSRRHESTPLLRSLEPSYGVDEEQPAASQYARPHPPHAAVSEEEYEPPRPPRSYRGLIKPLVVVLILLGVVGTISWQWPAISEFYQLFARPGAKQQTTQATPEAPAPQPKFPGRVPQENAGQGPAAGAQPNPAPPAVAQRVVLYEEDPNDPAGKRYVGSAIWRTETVSPGAGLAPELAVRADVEIPERRMSMTWSLRRNTDKALPASHTIEILFKLPADFPGGGIGNVPGILMKEAEQARGTPLAGLAVKVTNGFFLIGLSAAENDMQRNIALLKDRQWFDIPVVYANGGRAILAMEKGPPGDRAFAEAFAAWEKK